MTKGLKAKILYDGKVYDSQTHLAREIGITQTAVSVALRLGHRVKGHYAKAVWDDYDKADDAGPQPDDSPATSGGAAAEADVHRIYAAGHPPGVIAMLTGLSRGDVCRILGREW